MACKEGNCKNVIFLWLNVTLNSKENVVPDPDPKICLLIRQNDQDPANAGLFSHVLNKLQYLEMETILIKSHFARIRIQQS